MLTFGAAMEAARSLAAHPPTDISTALSAPGVERLREWAEIGPVQRAAVETFAEALTPGVPAAPKATLTDEQWRAAEASADPFLRCGCGAAMPCAQHYTHGVRATVPADPVYRGKCPDGAQCPHGCHHSDKCYSETMRARGVALPQPAVPDHIARDVEQCESADRWNDGVPFKSRWERRPYESGFSAGWDRARAVEAERTHGVAIPLEGQSR